MTGWQVERLGRRGDGVARNGAGEQALAALTLPGETILGKAQDGRIAAPRILTPSPHRVTPPCPHYSTCGGCSLMHGSDAFLRDWKVAQVKEALRAQGVAARVAGVNTSPPQSRRRVVLAGKRRRKGVLLGFHSRASAVIVDLQTCLLMRPAIAAALPLLREIVALGASRHAGLDLTVTETDAGLDVAVQGGRAIDPDLLQALAGLAQKGDLARLDWNGESLTRRAPVVAMGRAQVVVPPGGFLQATRQGEAALVTVVRDIIGDAARVLDLFAGCGTFTLPLAERAQVHAVEGLSAPLRALDSGWSRTPTLRKVTTEIRDLAQNPLQPDELDKYHAIVIDPPRAGAAAQARELARSKVQRLAWVSCDPVSFARDARILADGGWRISRLYVVDQFRWSPHVETVAEFTRS